MGRPSDILLSAGFPDLPISMRSGLLENMSTMRRHPFKPSDLKGLVDAILRPLAIFNYSRSDMRNLIVDISHRGKHFLVGVTLNYKSGGIEINSISGLFPKDNAEWIKWIQNGKAIKIDIKEKVLDLIGHLRTANTAASARIGLNLSEVANIAENFENPNIPGHNTKFIGAPFLPSCETYRVKTTIKEYRNEDHPKLYSFEVTEIKLLDSEESSNHTSTGRRTVTDAKKKDKNGLRKLSGKKLLQGVEKSYE